MALFKAGGCDQFQRGTIRWAIAALAKRPITGGIPTIWKETAKSLKKDVRDVCGYTPVRGRAHYYEKWEILKSVQDGGGCRDVKLRPLPCEVTCEGKIARELNARPAVVLGKALQVSCQEADLK